MFMGCTDCSFMHLFLFLNTSLEYTQYKCAIFQIMYQDLSFSNMVLIQLHMNAYGTVPTSVSNW